MKLDDIQACEEKRHLQVLDDLKRLAAAAAGVVSSAQHDQAIADENALHRLKMHRIQGLKSRFWTQCESARLH